MKRNLPPRIAALLIALALTGSAGAASAATTASFGSSLGYKAEMVMACVSGNVPACIGAGGVVTPDVPSDPSIKNKPN